MRVPPVVLSIAGYDPSSGAGVTADIKTAASLGCYAVTCITALTVQSTQGVFGVQALEPELGGRTLEALADLLVGEVFSTLQSFLTALHSLDEASFFLEVARQHVLRGEVHFHG